MTAKISNKYDYLQLFRNIKKQQARLWGFACRLVCQWFLFCVFTVEQADKQAAQDAGTE